MFDSQQKMEVWKVDDDFEVVNSVIEVLKFCVLKTYCLFTIVTNINSSPRVSLLNIDIVGLSVENP